MVMIVVVVVVVVVSSLADSAIDTRAAQSKFLQI